MDSDEDTKTEEMTSEKPEEETEESVSDVPTVDADASLKQEKSSKKLFIFGGAVVVIIILATVGFFFLSAKQPETQKTVSPQAESPTPRPTEISRKTLNRADWSMEVLNGSGIIGAARKIADKLKDLGYPVVKIGNADKDDYETSQILVREDLQDQTDLVLADIKDIVKIASVSGNLKDSTASARIISGKQ